MSIIETIQKSLGFNTLEKIDPNTQKTEGPDTVMGNNALAQAGIPAILIGIYNRLESNPNLAVLDSVQNGSYLESIFGKSSDQVVMHINEYSQIRDNQNVQQLEHIASESIRVVKEAIGKNTDETSIKNFVARNKPDALLYLPPSIELGKILKNNNLDDRTGKMEGPVSSFMHKVEKTFNS